MRRGRPWGSLAGGGALGPVSLTGGEHLAALAGPRRGRAPDVQQRRSVYCQEEEEDPGEWGPLVRERGLSGEACG